MKALRNAAAALALLLTPFIVPAIDTFAELRREKARRRLRYNQSHENATIVI